MARIPVKTLAKWGAILLGSYYAFTVVKVFFILRERRRKILSYTNTKYTPVTNRHISDEEFENMLAALQAKVPNPKVGMVSNAPPQVRELIAESISFAGGGSSALLQTAHPFVAKGVFDHSKVLENPLIRFNRTFYYMFRITFGDLETVLSAGRAVRKLHNRVSGNLSTDTGVYQAGSQYTAHDYEAVKWVFATLMDGILFSNEVFIRDIKQEVKDDVVRYLREGSVVFGIPPTEFPDNHKDFEANLFSVVNSQLLKVTSESQAICDALMKPLLYEKYLPFVNSLKTVTGVLLPEPVAIQYGFNVGFGAYLYTAMFAAAIRVVYSNLPRSFRYLTAYLEAVARENNSELPLQSKLAAKLGTSFVDAALRAHGNQPV